MFVDDPSAEAEGNDDDDDDEGNEHDEAVADDLGTFTRVVMCSIQRDGMEVNRIKSVISASSPSLAEKILSKLGDSPIGTARRVKSLGAGLAAG